MASRFCAQCGKKMNNSKNIVAGQWIHVNCEDEFMFKGQKQIEFTATHKGETFTSKVYKSEDLPDGVVIDQNESIEDISNWVRLNEEQWHKIGRFMGWIKN